MKSPEVQFSEGGTRARLGLVLAGASQFLAQGLGFGLAIFGGAPEAVLLGWIFGAGGQTRTAVDLDL